MRRRQLLVTMWIAIIVIAMISWVSGLGWIIAWVGGHILSLQ